MPIYEYKCQDCGTKFEKLLRRSDEAAGLDCPSCGQKLKRPCPKCERLLELRWTFCPYCATNLAGAPPMQSMPGMPGMPAMPGMQGGPGVPLGGPRY